MAGRVVWFTCRTGRCVWSGHDGEVEVPAYAAMRRPGAVADRMLEVLMAGVSTRKYGRVIGEMADTVGVSKSAVSRETVEASERVLKELMERRLDAWDLLVIYLDGIQMGSHHVLAAVGVDSDGKKHVLGVREGASENAEVTSALLEDLVERGLDPGRRRLFVIDGSKALRKAIEKVFGQRHPIQRCRNHNRPIDSRPMAACAHTRLLHPAVIAVYPLRIRQGCYAERRAGRPPGAREPRTRRACRAPPARTIVRLPAQRPRPR